MPMSNRACTGLQFSQKREIVYGFSFFYLLYVAVVAIALSTVSHALPPSCALLFTWYVIVPRTFKP